MGKLGRNWGLLVRIGKIVVGGKRIFGKVDGFGLTDLFGGYGGTSLARLPGTIV
jgi:hypothetical protein